MYSCIDHVYHVLFQVWFQNARAKYRRSVARQEVEARSSGSGAPSTGQQLDAGPVTDHQLHHRHHNRQLATAAASPTASADSGVAQPGRLSGMSASTSVSSLVTGCHADYTDLIDQTTTTNSVGSSMSEFLNSSLSDDVL
jgi:hypothetical protein